MSAVRKASGLASIRRVSVRDGSGVNPMGSMRVRTASGLSLVYSALSATLAGAGTDGYGNDPGTITIAAPLVTATPVGGSAPFTYSWARTDGGGGSWTITNPTGAATLLEIDLAPGVQASASFACTVTDASGATAVSEDWSVTCTNLGGGLSIGP